MNFHCDQINWNILYNNDKLGFWYLKNSVLIFLSLFSAHFTCILLKRLDLFTIPISRFNSL